MWVQVRTYIHAYMSTCAYAATNSFVHVLYIELCLSERADPFSLKERWRTPKWPTLQLTHRPFFLAFALGNGNWGCFAGFPHGFVRSVLVQCLGWLRIFGSAWLPNEV